jgi:xylan 1,4-beta-xylosidase
MNKFIIIFIAILLSDFPINYEVDEINIKVDATSVVGKLDPFWASQIVVPTEFLNTDWGENLLDMMKENSAAMQYIRMYNQPELAIRVRPDGEIYYDWSHFDEGARKVLAKGLIPKVMFWGMPVQLAKFPESVRIRPYGGVLGKSMPSDYKQWEELCADFTRHVIDKFGIEEVIKWTFRCGNEPNGQGFWYTGHDNTTEHLREYLKLYDHFAEGVKKVDPRIRVGGPALANSHVVKNPHNFRMVLDHFVNGTNFATGMVGSPVDFISIHVYGTTMDFIASDNPVDLAPSVSYMVNLMTKLTDIRDEFPSLLNTPIHVEEWGLAGAGTTGVKEKPHADIRNSHYSSAFLSSMVGRILSHDLYNKRLIESLTFCASGYERIPEHDFMGYRTLHTRSGFYKPLLNGYRLLGMLAPNLAILDPIDNHDISAVASFDKDRITVMVVNFQQDKLDSKGSMYPIDLQINTIWGKSREVTIKHWRIDEQHSNSYTAFKELGSPKLPNPLQIDAIKSRMRLELLEDPIKVPVQDLRSVKFDLPCNAVSLIEIIVSDL